MGQSVPALAAALAISWAGALHAAEGEPGTPRWTFGAEGDALLYRIRIEHEETLGRSSTAVLLEAWTRFEWKTVTESGDGEGVLALLNLSVTVRTPFASDAFDTRKEKGEAPEGEAKCLEPYRALLAAPLTLTVAPDGTVKKVGGALKSLPGGLEVGLGEESGRATGLWAEGVTRLFFLPRKLPDGKAWARALCFGTSRSFPALGSFRLNLTEAPVAGKARKTQAEGEEKTELRWSSTVEAGEAELAAGDTQLKVPAGRVGEGSGSGTFRLGAGILDGRRESRTYRLPLDRGLWTFRRTLILDFQGTQKKTEGGGRESDGEGEGD